MSVAVEPRRRRSLDDVREIADEVAAAERRRRRPRGPLPGRGDRRAARASGAVGARADRARRRRGRVRDDRRVLLRARPRAAARARWCSRCTRSRSRRSSATSTTRRGSSATCASSSERAAPDRVGDLRGRHRRRHGPLDRRRDAARTTARCTFEKQAPTVSYGAYADDLLTTLRRSPRRRARRPGRRARRARSRRRSSRPAPGTRSGCAAPARPASSSAPTFAAEQVLPTPFARGHGRVDGAGLAHPVVARVARDRRPTRSTARGRSCAPRPSASPASRCRRRTACRT